MSHREMEERGEERWRRREMEKYREQEKGLRRGKEGGDKKRSYMNDARAAWCRPGNLISAHTFLNNCSRRKGEREGERDIERGGEKREWAGVTVPDWPPRH